MKKITIMSAGSIRAYAAQKYLAKSASSHQNYAYRDMFVEGYDRRYNPLGIILGYWMDANKMTVPMLAKVGTEIGKQYGGILLTVADIHRYLDCVCCPKSEKMAILVKVTGLSESQLKGYTPIAGAPNLLFVERPEAVLRNRPNVA